MIVSIQPLTHLTFGEVNAVRIRGNSDNYRDRAAVWYALGRLSEDVFTQAPGTEGEVVLEGEEYAAWSGSNEEVPALILPKIPGVTPA